MLSDIDANDWMDITQLNVLIADTEDVIDVSGCIFSDYLSFFVGREIEVLWPA